jgi:hypothetical protein
MKYNLTPAGFGGSSPATAEEHERVQQVMRDWFRVIAP